MRADVTLTPPLSTPLSPICFLFACCLFLFFFSSLFFLTNFLLLFNFDLDCRISGGRGEGSPEGGADVPLTSLLEYTHEKIYCD